MHVCYPPPVTYSYTGSCAGTLWYDRMTVLDLQGILDQRRLRRCVRIDSGQLQELAVGKRGQDLRMAVTEQRSPLVHLALDAKTLCNMGNLDQSCDPA